MLFPYQYVPHSMEIMQSYIDFIFYEVWCRAKGRTYDIDVLFADNQELREMITELDGKKPKGANFFLTGLQEIFNDFKILSNKDIEQLKHCYQSNNCIEHLCIGDPSVTPCTYKTISDLSANSDLSDKLALHLGQFFKSLYSLSLQPVSMRIGHIDDHYKLFMTQNSIGKCPFCGIQDLKGIYHSKREAYDHYLPKTHYPFNSINFSNLVPTCYTCNSSYKHTKDPVRTVRNGRRKAFYPFTSRKYQIDIKISLRHKDYANLLPDDIDIKFGPDELSEEIRTWKEVYEIEERYKAKCCSMSDGKAWIVEVLDESQNIGFTPQEYLSFKLKTAYKQPWTDCNFIKKAFLEGCQAAGLFSE